MRNAELDNGAVGRLERELYAVHYCVDVLGTDRLLWLRAAFAEREVRLACALDSARRGWPSG
jgi:hypothetical protein